MAQRYTVVCNDRIAARIDALAEEYGLAEGEVLEQLVEIGLEQRDAAMGTRQRSL
jgi:hypothetical protein